MQKMNRKVLHYNDDLFLLTDDLEFFQISTYHNRFELNKAWRLTKFPLNRYLIYFRCFSFFFFFFQVHYGRISTKLVLEIVKSKIRQRSSLFMSIRSIYQIDTVQTRVLICDSRSSYSK